MIYLAGPYSHPDHLVMDDRAHQHSRFLLLCDGLGVDAYSPIVHWHPVSHGRGLLDTPEAWRRRSLAMLRLASDLWVLMLPGWETSKGTQIEIREAGRIGIKRSYFDAEGSLWPIRQQN